MSANLSIGFLGAGRMATALAKGFLKAGLVTPKGVVASDISGDARKAFEKETGARATAASPEVARFAKVLLLAVKPDQVKEVLSGIREQFSSGHCLISIAAGVRLAVMEEALGGEARVVRVMPNTPALIGASATAFAPGGAATAKDVQLTQRLFSAVGLAFQVREDLLDAVTGLSGSGPAYVYAMIEALSDGGVACGLPREVATRLAAQTVKGGAQMVLETGQHPGLLKDMVTSPGGTTIEGLHELERGGLRATIMNAVRVAARKSRRMGRK
ncbi:MAG TPA: pyrroline-5-carboxylate reductase [Methylomirabilota bacterium]|nr:pyrroline-5-carboxylate reductase [Methylomirabilota bacterium]